MATEYRMESRYNGGFLGAWNAPMLPEPTYWGEAGLAEVTRLLEHNARNATPLWEFRVVSREVSNWEEVRLDVAPT